MINKMRFQLGKATITLINAGNMQADWNERLREVQPEWRRRYPDLFSQPRHFPCQNILVQLPDTTLLIDAATYAPEAYPDFVIPEYVPPPPLWEQLSALDVSLSSIDHLIITHSHYDHFSGLTHEANGRLQATFPNATVYLSRLDWRRLPIQLALRKPKSRESSTLGFVEQAGQLSLLDGEQEIMPGVKVVPTPGETAGHQMVEILSEGKTLYCIGDLIQHPAELHESGWHGWWVDVKRAPKSIGLLRDKALGSQGIIAAAHIDGTGKIDWRAEPDGSQTAVWHPILTEPH